LERSAESVASELEKTFLAKPEEVMYPEYLRFCCSKTQRFKMFVK
jgi:hypothetical protein